MVKKMIRNQKGMTLIEVLISITLFGVFVTAFVTRNGMNLQSSLNFKSELKLRDLTTSIINEILINPPELTDSLTLSPKTKSIEGMPGFTYSIEWKNFEIPDYTKMSNQNQDDPRAAFQKKVFEQVKENMKLLVWQLAVEVKDSETNSSYRLATWLYNDKAKVQLSGF